MNGLALLAALLPGAGHSGDTQSGAVQDVPPAPPAATPAVQRVLIRFRPGIGKIYDYRFHAETPEPEAKSLLDMHFRMVAKGAKNGTTTVAASYREFSMEGRPMPDDFLVAFRKIRTLMVVDPTGKVLSAKNYDAPPGFTGDPPSSTTFPTTPLAVGDTWKADLPVMGRKLAVTYRLAEIGTRAGGPAVRIEAETREPTIENPLVSWIDLRDGMLIEAFYRIKQGSQSAEFRIDRLP